MDASLIVGATSCTDVVVSSLQQVSTRGVSALRVSTRGVLARGKISIRGFLHSDDRGYRHVEGVGTGLLLLLEMFVCRQFQKWLAATESKRELG